MIHLQRGRHPYWEEINPGVEKQFGRPKGPGRPLVLDVGCGSGALGQCIRDRGYEVWGIEEDRVAAERAAQRLDRVLRQNLLDFAAVRAAAGERRFDHLVFSDVLEHLYDPFVVLREYLTLVRNGGRVIISVPNALVWTNRLSFLCGRFEYADSGVMDRTHIRWFTFRTAKRLVRAAGCTLRRVDYTPHFVRALLPLIKRGLRRSYGQGRELADSPVYRFYSRFVYRLEYGTGYWLRSWFAFRIILVAVREENGK